MCHDLTCFICVCGRCRRLGLPPPKTPPEMGGLALFHTVHRNLGPDGPSALKCGLCGSIVGSIVGSMLVDLLSPKAAPFGDK